VIAQQSIAANSSGNAARLSAWLAYGIGSLVIVVVLLRFAFVQRRQVRRHADDAISAIRRELETIVEWPTSCGPPMIACSRHPDRHRLRPRARRFRTGFGWFTYLKHFPASYLKIDMEFVRHVSEDATDQHIIESISGIAHALGKRTIAEGSRMRQRSRSSASERSITHRAT
jgi:hypothetical protein